MRSGSDPGCGSGSGLGPGWGRGIGGEIDLVPERNDIFLSRTFDVRPREEGFEHNGDLSSTAQSEIEQNSRKSIHSRV